MAIDEDRIPICVDLDGTLLRSDLLFETLLALLRRNPFWLFVMPFWLLRGKAGFKAEIALRGAVEPEGMPFDGRVLELLARTSHRPRILCTAADERVATRIADHLGLFDGIIASDGRRNLSGREKAAALVERYGERGFDYAGNDAVDLHVWGRARKAWVVNASPSLARAAALHCAVEDHWPHEAPRLRTWLRALRVHQWLKNLLIFVPLLASHRFTDVASVVDAGVAFIAFGLCASSVYLLNDLVDLPSDRQHPRKCRRPFASGALSLFHGLIAAPLLTLLAFAVALWVGPVFAGVLAAYYAITLLYSFHLKRMVMVDVLTLAGLYTIRIVAGAAAIGIGLSFWLLAFSMFMFLGLAMVKRYTELRAALASGKDGASGRGYRVDDLPLIQAFGCSAGYLAVLVLALYINSPESTGLYSRPQVLWLLCPLLLYWTSRVWMIAHRGNMDDDPVVFAVKDRVSLLTLSACSALGLVAI